MVRLVIALLASGLSGCTPAPYENAEIANEAHVEIADARLAELRQRGEQGDREAIATLVNYYWINHGGANEQTIYWQLKAARLGDCEQWADIMFMVVDDGEPVPPHLFSEGETLVSIGEASGCPAYTSVKPR